MALQQRKYLTNDLVAKAEVKVFSSGTAGTLNGAAEYGFVAPEAGELDARPIDISVGVNTTHSSSASITASLEKNTDGGTSMLATAPVITDGAGTGFKTTAVTGTGITQSVRSATQANHRFAAGDVLFLTLTEAGSGGTDPSDVFFNIRWHPLTDNDPDATVARTS